MAPEREPHEPRRLLADRRTTNGLWVAGIVAACVLVDLLPAIAVALFSERLVGPVARALYWFDPLFTGYNVAMLVTAQVVVPLVTYMYITKMRGEKERRLSRDLPDRLWRENQEEIHRLLDGHFRLRNYVGSMAILLVIVTLGGGIILLMKPGSEGVDFTRGANFLMAGPLAEHAPTSHEFYHRIITSLVAFQFGFLGGYVYFIGALVRSYFTLDLSPHTYVESSVRMVVASILSLVVSFVLPLEAACAAGAEAWRCIFHPLPVVSFFLGYFPSSGLLFIQKYAAKQLGQSVDEYNATSLSALQGMSFAHEVRLSREGFDSVENLSHADSLDLAVRTGFSYRQLRHWIGQAWLRTHLGTHYNAFFDATGLTSRQELREFIEDLGKQTGGSIVDRLPDAGGAIPRTKLAALCSLLDKYEPHRNP
jgi:hypothetical protein